MTKNNDDDACQASKDVICYNSKHAKESTTNTQLLLSSSLQHMLLISYYILLLSTNKLVEYKVAKSAQSINSMRRKSHIH